MARGGLPFKQRQTRVRFPSASPGTGYAGAIRRGGGSVTQPGLITQDTPVQIRSPPRSHMIRCSSVGSSNRLLSGGSLVRVQSPERNTAWPCRGARSPRHPVKVKTAGSNPVSAASTRSLVLVRAGPRIAARGSGGTARRNRSPADGTPGHVAQRHERCPDKAEDPGSIPGVTTQCQAPIV